MMCRINYRELWRPAINVIRSLKGPSSLLPLITGLRPTYENLDQDQCQHTANSVSTSESGHLVIRWDRRTHIAQLLNGNPSPAFDPIKYDDPHIHPLETSATHKSRCPKAVRYKWSSQKSTIHQIKTKNECIYM